MADSIISVIGLGKLGAPLGAALAAGGLSVVGVDVNKATVEAINRGEPPGFEPRLAETLEKADGRFTATTDIRDAVLRSSVSFVVVPTPSEKSGGFALDYVLAACDKIGKSLRDKSDFHLVAITSTVMPGSTGGPIRQMLEQASGRRSGVDLGLCYSPEFIALGSVIRDFLNPDFILIGESDPRSGDILQKIYGKVCENNPPVVRMGFVDAELAKLSVNTFVTLKISFSNMLARICERLPGANIDVVTSALGLDSRIGSKYLKGAIGYGGPCFPRDNVALASMARRIGAPAVLAEATDRSNREEVNRLVALVQSVAPAGGTVAVLGLAYKPNTDVIEESQGLLLLQALAQAGFPIVAFDPAAMKSARRVLDGQAHFAESIETCVEEADVVVITTPWDCFRGIEPGLWERGGKRRVVIDCWRLLDEKRLKDVVHYIPLGVGRKDLASFSGYSLDKKEAMVDV